MSKEFLERMQAIVEAKAELQAALDKVTEVGKKFAALGITTNFTVMYGTSSAVANLAPHSVDKVITFKIMPITVTI